MSEPGFYLQVPAPPQLQRLQQHSST